MEYLQRLLDVIDRFGLLIAGLVGAVVASWWHKDDLTDWRAWLVFLITGVACSLYLTSIVSAYPSQSLVSSMSRGSTVMPYRYCLDIQ